MERRKLKRRHLVVYPKVIDRQTGRMLGRISDIHEEGMMIVSEKALPIPELIDVRVNVPAEPKEAGFFDAVIETTWGKEDKNPELTCTGSRILGMSDNSREIVTRTIDNWSFSDL